MHARQSPQAPAAQPGGQLPDEWRVDGNRLPVARYIDPGFAELEARQFWPRVWQMAAHLDQIPTPGDYTVYDILKDSVVLVRSDVDTVRAFHNACPHRATAFATGSGRFQLNTITCPFHGWKWDLSGSNTFIQDAEGIAGGCPKREDVDLREVKVALWQGFVFINFDPDAPPFEDTVAPIAPIVEGVLMGEMHHHYHYQFEAASNWKVAQEAFMEAYHVPMTHPQLYSGEPSLFTDMYAYRTFAFGHGLFTSRGQTNMGMRSAAKTSILSKDDQVDALVKGLRNLALGQDAQVHAEEVELARSMRHRAIPEGQSVGEAFQDVVREHFRGQGRPIGAFSALQECNDMHIFPHVTFLPTFGNVLMYRVRPTRDNDPDRCIFDMYAFRTYAEGEPVPRWKTVEYDGDPTDRTAMFLIPTQDFSNVPRQQQGLHSRGLDHVVLHERQEMMIRNSHEEIDRYLDGSR